MIGADGEDFAEGDALEFAQVFDNLIVERIAKSCQRLVERHRLANPDVLVCGSGESLARRVAQNLPFGTGSIRRLSEMWGTAGSEAACARAIVELMKEDT